MIGDQEDMGASASGPGSREPSPSVPLVSAASGFDPSRMDALNARIDALNAEAFQTDKARPEFWEQQSRYFELQADIQEWKLPSLATYTMLPWGLLVGRYRALAATYASKAAALRDSDGSPSGARPGTGLDGEAATARAEGIAQILDEQARDPMRRLNRKPKP